MPFQLQDIFSSDTARWFEKAFGTPTPVQQQAWPAIASGQHTLVSAPTGTGKTLSAFLVFLDQLTQQARAQVRWDKRFSSSIFHRLSRLQVTSAKT